MKIAATTILTHQAPALIEQWDRTTHDADYRQIVVTQGASNEAFLAARATECEILHLRVSPLRYDTVHNAATWGHVDHSTDAPAPAGTEAAIEAITGELTA